MDDAQLVRGLERFGDLARERKGVRGWHRPGGDQVRQVFALHQLHDQRARAGGEGVRFESVDLRDAGMVERRERLRLSREAGEVVGVRREQRRQDLDRDAAIELRVTRAIDLAHAAGAERPGDLVDPDPGASVHRHVGE